MSRSRIQPPDLRHARSHGRAVIGFSIYNLEQGLGVLRAAEAEGAPVLLQAGASAFRYAGREPLARIALALADSARVPVGVHLDHSTDLAEIDACLALGYTSVMFDGSARSIEENVSLTREVVTRAHRVGAWVEAELVGIAGDEDRSSDARAGALTDPDIAQRFVAATGVDALAVSVGNVHGIPQAPVSLDLERLQQIGEAVQAPLVLHGASGLPDIDVLQALRLGVAKLNVNAELRVAFRKAWLASASEPRAGDALPDLLTPVIAATQEAAQEKLRTFSVPAPARA